MTSDDLGAAEERRGRRQRALARLVGLVLLLGTQALAQLPPLPVPSLPVPVPSLQQPTARPTATITPTATATGSPTLTPTPFVGGQVDVTSIADTQGTANQTVGAGDFQLVNNTGSPMQITGISIAASDPVVFSSLVLTATSSTTSQTATAANPGPSNNFPFTSLEIPAGGTASCTLTATISSASGSSTSTRGSSPRGSGTAGAGLAMILLAALAALRGRRQRLAAATLLLAFWVGAYAGCGGNQSSAQTLMDVTASSGGGGVTFNGVPASLGTVSRPQPLTLSGTHSAATVAPTSSQPTSTPAPGTPTAAPGTPTATPAPVTPTATPAAGTPTATP